VPVGNQEMGDGFLVRSVRSVVTDYAERVSRVSISVYEFGTREAHPSELKR
jgi:nicotinic acid phosphoribosyltransferase